MKRRFCVVVPARNEAVVIEATLNRLIEAGAPPEDIYLIDDCSEDDTGDIARLVGVHVMRNDPNLGKALSIDRVVDEYDLTQEYEFIGLMDADTLVDLSYFTEMLKSFEDEEVVVVCGRPISQHYNWLTAYRALNYANGHYVYRMAQGKMGMICIAPGCATMYRSSVFNKLDWHNDTKAEDMYVTIQVYHERLGEVAYASKAKVYTQTPRTLKAYMKQMDRWYGGTMHVILKQRVFFRNMKVDWECKLLWTEGLITAVMRLMFPFVALALPFLLQEHILVLPWWLAWGQGLIESIAHAPPYVGSLYALAVLLVGSYLVSLPATFIFALLERRWDIVLYSPMYPLMWYVDVIYFLRAFVWVVILRKKPKSKNWDSPPRYVEKGKTA